MRARTVMPAVQNVAAGSTAFINLPVGLIYDALAFRYVWDNATVDTDATAATFGADFTEVRLKLDGEAVQTYRGTELGDLNAYYGRTHVNGVMPIHLTPPWARFPNMEDDMGWATGADVRSFTVEVDLAAAAVPVSLKVYAVARAPSDGKPKSMGIHRAVKRYVSNAGSTGVLDWTDLNLDPNARLLAAHFKSANISSMEIKANNRVIFDQDNAVNEDWMERRAVERAAQSGYFHAEFTENNRIQDGLPLAGLQDLRFRPTFTGTGAFTVIAETLEVWRG